MTRLGLIDYGMGNLHSVQRAFERLGATVLPVHGVDDINDCQALVLPGVGAFDPAMARLRAADLVEPLRRSSGEGRPLLGICLGLQLLFDGSDEGEARGLGLLPGQVRALPRTAGQRIPHMGWAPLIEASPSPLLPADSPASWVYFVHSYAAVPAEPACATARIAWGEGQVTAAVWQGPVAGCQFHPEKSGPTGEAMLRRWLDWVAGGQPR